MELKKIEIYVDSVKIQEIIKQIILIWFVGKSVQKC